LRRVGDWPFRVAIRVYADADRIPILQADNPEWGTREWIKCRDVPTVIAVVQRGEGPIRVMNRLRTSDGRPLFKNPTERLPAFYMFNGGQDRVLHPGDAVSIPVAWVPPSLTALARARRDVEKLRG
jgi:hypothetical protein